MVALCSACGSCLVISVVIPLRDGGSPRITLESLGAQNSAPDFEIIVSHDASGFGDSRGANWARNRGAELARGEYLLFSDDDIKWQPLAIRELHFALQRHPRASYAFGSYRLGSSFLCAKPFNERTLLRYNIAPTMALVRRKHFPGFDESIARLQDWDLWLTMLSEGHKGVHCGSMTFITEHRDGITQNGWVEYDAACDRIAEKHGLRKRIRTSK